MKLERMQDTCGCAHSGADAGGCAQPGADACGCAQPGMDGRAAARPLPGAPASPARDDAPC